MKGIPPDCVSKTRKKIAFLEEEKPTPSPAESELRPTEAVAAA